MARDSGSEFSGTFDNMLDENRQRLDNLLGRRATAAPDRQSKPATAERRTERQTERPTESRTGRKTGRKSGCGGGQNFSFEVDVSHKKKGAIAMALPNVGEQAPAFSMRNQQGADTTLEQYKGHYVVLWWYPKADTPG
jgi:peroxiredoxin Q/BCP